MTFQNTYVLGTRDAKSNIPTITVSIYLIFFPIHFFVLKKFQGYLENNDLTNNSWPEIAMALKVQKNSIRQWLIENKYEDVAQQIDEILVEWKKKGKGTRRNWWDVLAGGKNGNPKRIEGRIFPMLKAARIRKNLKPVKHAICRNKNEKVPRKLEPSRWKSKI